MICYPGFSFTGRQWRNRFEDTHKPWDSLREINFFPVFWASQICCAWRRPIKSCQLRTACRRRSINETRNPMVVSSHSERFFVLLASKRSTYLIRFNVIWASRRKSKLHYFASQIQVEWSDTLKIEALNDRFAITSRMNWYFKDWSP